MNFDWHFLSIDQIQDIITGTIKDGYEDYFDLLFKYSVKEMAERTLGLNERLTDRIIIQISSQRTVKGICATINHEIMHAVLFEVSGEQASNSLDKIILLDLEFFQLAGGAIL